MKCDHCGEQIELLEDVYIHSKTLLRSCASVTTATPRKLQPNTWCTDQEWIGAGGDWKEFHERFVLGGSLCRENIHRSWVGENMKIQTVRSIVLDGNAKLPKTRVVPQINPLHIPLGWWIYQNCDCWWYACIKKPIMSEEGFVHHNSEYSFFPLRKLGIDDWRGDWEDSLFSREELAEAWESKEC